MKYVNKSLTLLMIVMHGRTQVDIERSSFKKILKLYNIHHRTPRDCNIFSISTRRAPNSLQVHHKKKRPVDHVPSFHNPTHEACKPLPKRSTSCLGANSLITHEPPSERQVTLSRTHLVGVAHACQPIHPSPRVSKGEARVKTWRYRAKTVSVSCVSGSSRGEGPRPDCKYSSEVPGFNGVASNGSETRRKSGV